MCGSGLMSFASSTSPFSKAFPRLPERDWKAVGAVISPLLTFSSTSSAVAPSTGGRSVRMA
jgi:hypothetical protein